MFITGLLKKTDEWIKKVDKMNLWYLGIPLVLVLFVPIFLLGEGSVFEIHDQLDETLFTYVATAKHMFSGVDVYPEMMGGVQASGMLPAAVFFVPLYGFLPTFTAFVIQYMIVCASAFFGMYLLVRKVTESSGLALLAGALFCMLPYQPVYGLSVVGIPLLICCFWLLLEKKHVIPAFLGIVYFGLTTHLVLIGYVALVYLAIGGVCLLIKHRGIKKQDFPYYAGAILLFSVYCLVNVDLIIQLLVGAGGFVSHREELLNNTLGINVWKNIADFFFQSGQHVPTCQKYMMLPLALITVVQGIRYKSLSGQGKKRWKLLMLLWAIAALTAIVAGFFGSTTYMSWKNEQSGFFRYFQPGRFYWIYAFLWMFAFGVALSLVWQEFAKWCVWIKVGVLLAVVAPTAYLVVNNSFFYTNVNQYNNGSRVTGYQSWETFYMEDILELVDAHIGRDKSTYRIANLGIGPGPALMYGFYTIDGYSNNYSLDYKHSFREIIEAELDKNYDNKIYFDTWGSRCYLLSAESGRNWYIQRHQNFKYTDLELNTGKMAELGCEYIFSAAEIENAEDMNLSLESVFNKAECFYEIWLYRIGNSEVKG